MPKIDADKLKESIISYGDGNNNGFYVEGDILIQDVLDLIDELADEEDNNA